MCLIPTSLGEAYILIPIYPKSVSFSTINMIDGTMIFSYMRRLGFKILNFNFFFFGGGRVQKNSYFLRYEDLWIYLGGHNKIRLYLGVIYMHFRIFSYGHWGTEWGIFWGVAKISNIFWRCLQFLIIFWSEWLMLGSSLCVTKK